MSDVKFQYSFKEVDIGNSDKTKRETLEKNEGKLAIVGDNHHLPFYPVGRLRKYDSGVIS